MKYKVILTHNPQDYYEGIEDEELVEIRGFDLLTVEQIAFILHMVDEGYKAIFQQESDPGG